jgi:hypothetical protein
MTNPNTERAARVIAAAIVHGTSADVALEVAAALHDARLLVQPAARPAKSPAAVATLDRCRRAKQVADIIGTHTGAMPGEPDVSAAGGEVSIVVHPRSLDDWARWLRSVGAGDARGDSTGVSMIVRATYSGARIRLVGVGVPALYGAQLARPDRKTAVRP